MMRSLIVGVTGIVRAFDDAAGTRIAAGESVVSASRVPDARTERYRGTPTEFRAATAQEIADYDAAQVVAVDAAAVAAFDTNKLLKAKALSDLAWRLGKAPGALTPGEIAAERTRIVNIYKAL